MDFFVVFCIIAVVILVMMIKIVPHQEAWVVEKLGKFDRVLEPGLNLLVPVIQKVAYKHSLKEDAIDVNAQTAVSNDNVTLTIDGVLYIKIIDPVAASYGVTDPYYAISQLAQTTMRSEIGKLQLDKTFEERELLNVAIVNAINQAATNWGIQCMRYEIKDIHPPKTVLQAMELQVAAERQKRAQILESEGSRQSKINNAEGAKAEVVLNSEALYIDQVNRARGESEAIALVAEATAKSITTISEALQKKGGDEAVSYKIAEQYIEAFSGLAKEGNSIIIPSNVNDPSSMIAQALAVFKGIGTKDNKNPSKPKKVSSDDSKNVW